MTTLFAWSGSTDLLDGLDSRKVTQCALSRVCAMCGVSLGRPIAFVGTDDEVGRNAFHVPPLHATCADDVRRHAGADPGW